jgi:hypothetical protein
MAVNGLAKRMVYLSAMLLVLNGCHSCDSDSDSEVSFDDDDGIGPNFGPPRFNGFTCETADSHWSCSSQSPTHLDFAIYLTFEGIALLRSPGEENGAPESEMLRFTWQRTAEDRIDITTEDGEPLTATDVDGSIETEFLDFLLDGRGFMLERFACRLRKGEVLDANCNGVVDSFERTPAASPTATPTATPTPTPTPSLPAEGEVDGGVAGL